ncbi:glycosyltransferase family 8 protein [Neisseria lisongii]|uniref:Glycosyltransferase family 8 protein n=1 Tax=Neisseria lisongii TaxID=2912188 RepID=A0AAW5AFI3_9NEIS|nr:glycosyltransferase family 8 protein [Neisseria lisongii]MCF7530084.1 glycosyltransferase family 8 protein [Neisseria lisongii]
MMNIVLAADLRMAEQVLTVIKSVCYHNQNVCFYLLHKEYSPEWFALLNRYLVKINCEIKSIPIDATLPEIFKVPHLSEAALYRLIIDQVVDKKALYLDCDIVVTANLQELYQTDISHYYVAAVDDAFIAQTDDHYYLEFPDMKPYFNSGVLLINAEKWRENDVLTKSVKMLNEYNFIYADQDMLNILFVKQWLQLDSSYNFQCHAQDVLSEENWQAYRQSISGIPKIIHYTSGLKPWKNGVECPFREQYWFYYGLEWNDIIRHHQQAV